MFLILSHFLYSLNFYRKECFTTDYFKGCLDVLQLADELDIIKQSIKIINGADPIIS